MLTFEDFSFFLELSTFLYSKDMIIEYQVLLRQLAHVESTDFLNALLLLLDRSSTELEEGHTIMLITALRYFVETDKQQIHVLKVTDTLIGIYRKQTKVKIRK